jgi:hypothetical protein
MRLRVLCLLIPSLTMAQEPSAVFGTTVVIPSGLRGDIYYLPQNTQTLADLAHLRPQGAIYTTSLNVPPQDFLIGFPGITKRFEWFAIDYSGKFWIEIPGLYRFRLVSDDGAMLYVDGQLIADNDGVHSTTVRLGSIRLAGARTPSGCLTFRARAIPSRSCSRSPGRANNPAFSAQTNLSLRPTLKNGASLTRQRCRPPTRTWLEPILTAFRAPRMAGTRGERSKLMAAEPAAGTPGS